MKRSRDLTDILRDWEYDEDNNVRFLTGEDGREIMQIRQPLGIEQYDLDGRPDGTRPRGSESYLEVYRIDGDAPESRRGPKALEDEDFTRLHDEGVLYYHRYLALFQVGLYDRVVRDTAHNLEICGILEDRYAGTRRFEMLQYRPYIRRMNAIARAMMKLADDRTGDAMVELERGKAEIEGYPDVPTPIYEFEKIRSLQHLSQVISQVATDADDEESDGLKGFRDRLTEELKKAVENEDYERAARLRDRIRRLD